MRGTARPVSGWINKIGGSIPTDEADMDRWDGSILLICSFGWSDCKGRGHNEGEEEDAENDGNNNEGDDDDDDDDDDDEDDEDDDGDNKDNDDGDGNDDHDEDKEDDRVADAGMLAIAAPSIPPRLLTVLFLLLSSLTQLFSSCPFSLLLRRIAPSLSL